MVDMGIRGLDKDAQQRFCCRTLRWVILTAQKQGIRLADIQLFFVFLFFLDGTLQN
jgi:hypothetical protein